MRIYLLLSALLFSLSVAAQKNDSVSVYFALNDHQLSRQAIHRIDSLMYNDVIRPGKNVMILGYTDYLGSEGYNKTLSYNRAIAVQKYLISAGIKKQNIILCIGKGKIERAPLDNKLGYADDRRVQIITGKFIVGNAPHIQVKTDTPKVSLLAKVDISKLQKNETLRLDNIYFLPGRHQIVEESIPQLELLYEVMKAHPSLRIRIEGHICCASGMPYKRQYGNNNDFEDGYDFDMQTYDLSVRRAEVIYDYLIKRGIAASRLQYQGFGATRPLVKQELTEDDRNKNRRVEIRILDK